MGRLLDHAIEFLNEDGWRFDHHIEHEWVALNYGSHAGAWLSWIQDRGSFLIVYAVLPVKAPPARRAAVAEFITRANFGLAVGNFELEMATGVVRFKNGVASRSADDVAGPLTVRLLFQHTNWTMEDYFEGLMSIIYGSATAEEAVVRAEQAIAQRRAAAQETREPADDEAETSGVGTQRATAHELEELLATLEAGFADTHTEEAEVESAAAADNDEAQAF